MVLTGKLHLDPGIVSQLSMESGFVPNPDGWPKRPCRERPYQHREGEERNRREKPRKSEYGER